jgi:hypothetical protein
MSFMTALKSFFKALKDPAAGEKFLAGGRDDSLRLLAKMQQEGRLIDFFQEEISGYQDADIGLCVRKIHQDCRKILNVAPIVNQDEGLSYTVEPGYDPEHIKVVGKASGKPPFAGIVRHKGWRSGEAVLQPAEIEVK